MHGNETFFSQEMSETKELLTFNANHLLIAFSLIKHFWKRESPYKCMQRIQAHTLRARNKKPLQKNLVGGKKSCFTSMIKHGWIRKSNSVELQLIDLGQEQTKTKKEFY